MKKVRTRFAPSPTGYMHIGNLRTALYGYLYAMKEGGDFILRLEDTDSKRYVDGAVQIIYDTLKDAGIRYAEGPDVGGDFGPYIQSERGAIYRAYAEKLVELGGAYYCFCDKERIDSLKDENGIGRYDKHCLHLSKEEIREKLAAGVPYVIRQNIPESGTGSYTDLVYGEVSVDFKDIEDGVLLKSDGMPTYNFANVVDDHLMGITHVIRGSEYLSSTPKYNLMYDAFGWERPAYIHLPPIMKNSHEKLSKRNGDASYQDLVDKGYVKEAIVNYIALLGWSPKSNVEKMTLRELEENFSLAGINKSPSIFDEPKLRWLSGEYIKAMTDEEFLSLSEPFLQKSKAYGKYDSLKLAHILKTRTEVMSDIPSKIDFIEEFGPFDSALYFNKKMKSDENIAREVLPDALEKLSSLETFENAAIYAALCDLAAARGMKNGQVLWCVRVALTGRENTPGGASEMAEILGKERSLERISKALGFLGGK
ncbi:glutamate--tRNA ligase [Candidatus Borkfalkia ceftriaxoniphila]|uniref:Glutamate--tRNA ligase n=1 Tax=Candidatus Borkfalkia ceftriaxoniphila TaxID=2508949 RepID=A0A4Q2K9C8_9FIRM|nr:glutamate--tRNA ligase [Candidatus Borkfalkia ceftriaxoniphila]RXZ61258.1 glutamate--tRNA ligase [Candidatus Borkfalkia ceftriaxoniphila]